jgi:hypothetical protein
METFRALLSNLKSEVVPADNPAKKTVLFCNPNGVFIEFFANHEYITNYLKQVILIFLRDIG